MPPKTSFANPQPGMVIIPWSCHNHALMRIVIATLKNNLDLRLSLWPQPGDHVLPAQNLTEEATAVRLAELTFDCGELGSGAKYAIAIRLKVSKLKKAYLELRDRTTDPEYHGPLLAKFLGRKEKMELYLDQLCVLNGDNPALFGVASIHTPGFMVIRPADVVKRETMSTGNSNSRSRAAGKGTDGGNEKGGRIQEVKVQDKILVAGEPGVVASGQSKRGNVFMEAVSKGTRSQGKINSGMNTFKPSRSGESSRSIKPSLAPEKAASNSKAGKQIEEPTHSPTYCRKPSTQSATPVIKGPNRASHTRNLLKRPNPGDNVEAEERKATRKHERYMIDAQIRLTEAEIALAQIQGMLW